MDNAHGFPFGSACAELFKGGWFPMPLPPGKKGPPPTGYTGDSGKWVAVGDLLGWVGPCASHNVATRIPNGVVGIDVDHYDKGKVHKRGGDTLAEYEQRWGALPETWRSSARELPSGIRFFRVPEDARFVTKLGDAIEIIQPHHRYAVVSPSWNPDGDASYQWFTPDGSVSTSCPVVSALPELPAAWVEGLREGATVSAGAPASYSDGEAMLAGLQTDARQPCAHMANMEAHACAQLSKASEGSRHDALIEGSHLLIMTGAEGHPGAMGALEALRAVWDELVLGEDRGAEWERAVLGTARKAARRLPVPRPYTPDEVCGPCIMGAARQLPADAGTVVSVSDTTEPAVAPVAVWVPRMAIGTHLWEPPSSLDHDMATAGLERMHPVLRYAVDSDQWLLRAADRWLTSKNKSITEWAAFELAALMPRGSADAPPGSAELTQHKRRARLMSSAGMSALAKMMKAAVAGGWHPSSLRIADLDTEPWLLWTGNVAWDLRKSTEELHMADVAPGTPHLHTARYVPADVPTPQWEAFLATVWPDAELRAWALRVIGVSLTGYPDAALPILLGPTRTGKTTLARSIMNVLGTYAVSADPRLLQSGDNSHASILYALKGARLAFIDEAPRANYGAQERLKQLTGGGALTANAMRADPVTFDPTHTLLLTANPESEPQLTDPAVQARVRLIPCDGDPDDVRHAVQALTSQWEAEAPGILAQLMREAARWLSDRDSALTSAAPESAQDRVALISAEQDTVWQWVTEETVSDEVGTRSSALYAAYVSWDRSMGRSDRARVSSTAFGRRLTACGYPPEHRRDGRYRLMRVRPAAGSGLLPGVPGGAGDGLPASRDGFTASRDGFVTGSDANPSHTVLPGQSPQTTPSVNSVTGFSSSTTNNQTHHIYIQKISGNPVTTVNPSRGGAETPPDQACDGLSEPVTAPADPSQPVTPTRARDTKSGKMTKAAAKQAEREAKRAAAAGPRYPLPAGRARGGAISPLSADQAREAIQAALARSGLLGLDVEHSGYPEGHRLNVLKTVQLGDSQHAVVLDPADPAQADIVREALAEAPVINAHSATADVVPIIRHGMATEEIWARVWDTVIPAKLASPSTVGNGDSVKALSSTVLDDAESADADKARAAYFKVNGWLTNVQIDTPVERSGWAQADHTCETMIRYDTADVLDCAALPAALPKPDPALHERERAIQRITARVSLRGVAIDRDKVQSLIDVHEPAKTEARDKLYALGLPIEDSGHKAKLIELLTARGARLPHTEPTAKFPNGQPSLSKGTLNALANADGALGELVGALLDYRAHDKALSTYLYPYRDLCDHGDGRARPTVYTLGAETGRMSCVRPNAQNVPRAGGYRSSWVADPGWMFVTADFSSVEVRVMAALSQDPELIRQLKEGVDLHGVVSELAFGDREKHNRYIAKRGVFGWAYGGSAPTLAEQLGVSVDMMRRVIDALRQIAPTYVAWVEDVKTLVRRGAVSFPSYSGRVIHLDQKLPHKAANFLVQGTARELLGDALLAYDQTPYGGQCVLPVHDEVITFARVEYAKAATQALVECMTTELYGVPIVAEASEPSLFWRDAE